MYVLHYIFSQKTNFFSSVICLVTSESRESVKTSNSNGIIFRMLKCSFLEIELQFQQIFNLNLCGVVYNVLVVQQF